MELSERRVLEFTLPHVKRSGVEDVRPAGSTFHLDGMLTRADNQ